MKKSEVVKGKRDLVSERLLYSRKAETTVNVNTIGEAEELLKENIKLQLKYIASLKDRYNKTLEREKNNIEIRKIIHERKCPITGGIIVVYQDLSGREKQTSEDIERYLSWANETLEKDKRLLAEIDQYYTEEYNNKINAVNQYQKLLSDKENQIDQLSEKIYQIERSEKPWEIRDIRIKKNEKFELPYKNVEILDKVAWEIEKEKLVITNLAIRDKTKYYGYRNNDNKGSGTPGLTGYKILKNVNVEINTVIEKAKKIIVKELQKEILEISQQKIGLRKRFNEYTAIIAEMKEYIIK